MILGLTDEALRGFDNNMATVVIFLDLSAAFDTSDIDKLLHIMESEIGISGTALQWFRSFLTGQTQRVKISGEYSSGSSMWKFHVERPKAPYLDQNYSTSTCSHNH